MGSSAYTDVNTLLQEHARRRPAKGVGHGDRISLVSDNAIEALVVFWGALRAGVIVNPINVEIREQHVSHILRSVAPKLVFWSRELPGAPRRLGLPDTPWIPLGTWGRENPPDDLLARLAR